MTENLLVFLAPDGGAEGWLLVQSGAVVARGDGLAELPGGARVVTAVVPGEDVGLHWLDLPVGLAPAQAQAAARLLAAEVSAQPLGEVHVAVGREGELGALRPVALAPVAAMERWLETLSAIGLDADVILPDTALLPVPEEGYTRYDRGSIALWRAADQAFALEADLAEMLVNGGPVAVLAPAAFEAAVPAALERPLVNLRQGVFARRRSWRLQGPRLRRLAFLSGALAIVTLLLQIAQILIYTVAADRLEEETRRIAATALSRSPGAAGASDLNRRLAELRGGGLGFGAIAGAVFGAIKGAPNVELSSLAFMGDGTMRISVRADSAPSLADFAGRVEASGFVVERLPPRTAEGRQTQDMVVRPR